MVTALVAHIFSNQKIIPHKPARNVGRLWGIAILRCANQAPVNTTLRLNLWPFGAVQYSYVCIPFALLLWRRGLKYA